MIKVKERGDRLTQKQREYYENKGLYCYDLISEGLRDTYVRKYGLVNHIGCLITSKELPLTDEFYTNVEELDLDYVGYEEDLTDDKTLKEEILIDEFKEYCEERGLEWVSADDMHAYNDLTVSQERYIDSFIDRWNRSVY